MISKVFAPFCFDTFPQFSGAKPSLCGRDSFPSPTSFCHSLWEVCIVSVSSESHLWLCACMCGQNSLMGKGIGVMAVRCVRQRLVITSRLLRFFSFSLADIRTLLGNPELDDEQGAQLAASLRCV